MGFRLRGHVEGLTVKDDKVHCTSRLRDCCALAEKAPRSVGSESQTRDDLPSEFRLGKLVCANTATTMKAHVENQRKKEVLDSITAEATSTFPHRLHLQVEGSFAAGVGVVHLMLKSTKNPERFKKR